MGGYGSGQCEREDSHRLIEEAVRLDLRKVRRAGPLYPGEAIRVMLQHGRSQAGPREVTVHVDRGAVELHGTVRGHALQQQFHTPGDGVALDVERS